MTQVTLPRRTFWLNIKIKTADVKQVRRRAYAEFPGESRRIALEKKLEKMLDALR